MVVPNSMPDTLVVRASFRQLFVVLLMAGCPGLYDSKRRFTAQRHYLRAPREETKREVEEAKRLDRRDIRVFESIICVPVASASASELPTLRRPDFKC